MRRKLTLDTADLRVESFETLESDRAMRGTVAGNAAPTYGTNPCDTQAACESWVMDCSATHCVPTSWQCPLTEGLDCDTGGGVAMTDPSVCG